MPRWCRSIYGVSHSVPRLTVRLLLRVAYYYHPLILYCSCSAPWTKSAYSVQSAEYESISYCSQIRPIHYIRLWAEWSGVVCIK